MLDAASEEWEEDDALPSSTSGIVCDSTCLTP